MFLLDSLRKLYVFKAITLISVDGEDIEAQLKIIYSVFYEN